MSQNYNISNKIKVQLHDVKMLTFYLYISTVFNEYDTIIDFSRGEYQ